LHPQDIAYDVAGVLDIIEGNGLRFQCWGDNHDYYPDGIIPSAHPIRPLIEALPERQQWTAVEKLSVATGAHYFVACRPERPNIDIPFSGDAWLNYRPVQHPAFEMMSPASVQKPGEFKREGRAFKMHVAEAVLYEQANGQTAIAAMMRHPNIVKNPPDQLREFCRVFFARMWRLGHLFFLK